MDKLTRFFKKVIKVAARPEMQILPGQLAFFIFLSIIPLVALIAAIIVNFSIPLAEVQSYIRVILPESLAKFVLSVESYTTLNFNIVVFFITAFILASNGTHSMIVTSNELYKIKPKSYLKRRLKAIGMTTILVCVLIFILCVPVFGDDIFNIIKDVSKNTSLVNFLHNVYHIVKYPLSILVVYINIKLLYVIAPDKKLKHKTTTKGAIFTTISWIISTEIYTFYINKFAVYDLFYGSISNIIVLLLWIYILSYLFVLGMALNTGDHPEDDVERTKEITKEDIKKKRKIKKTNLRKGER
ncbi:MAG: YihY/virulence factor BrkB family protein [Bacilli bacterium]|nr:YihY/virulence factor BrkB family protein [Bacilli bacterium]MBR3049139.1 YihY/virulence factor BrkB family protein [Bacilli bacterium]